MMKTEPLRLMVAAFRAEAKDVISLELRDPNGSALPAFAPGSHLEISVPVGAGERPLIRHYSLCNSAAERDRYVVAVGRAEAGRGGSQAVHFGVRVGMTLSVQPPRNNFPLVETAEHYRFIAGGIGITPILSMLRWCDANRKSWSLLYCTRSRQRTAFYEELKAFGDRVRFHFDDENGGRAPDLVAELSQPLAGEHVFCCGPKPLMLAVETGCAMRATDTVHFEWFSAKEVAHAPSSSRSFRIVLRQSGMELDVPADRSILETLEDNGLSVPFSCREGLCRTCETGLCSGQADHRDFVLSDEERNAQTSMMICVSRARSEILELDL